MAHSDSARTPQSSAATSPSAHAPRRRLLTGAYWAAGGFAVALGLSSAVPSAQWHGSASAQSASALAQAQSLSSAFSQVAESVSPSVVSIKVEAKAAVPQGFFFGGMTPEARQGVGSGFVFRADGAILTNNHVVDNATRVEVKLQDGRIFAGKVVGTDPATDLAVVKIEASGLTPVKFANSDTARVGEWVVAIGSPFGLDYTLTAGVLSAKGRGIGANEIEDYLQTDASINPGNSGGPLINLHGQVLGINTVIVGPRNAGVGFAIPSNLVRMVGEQLLKNGEVSRAYIGVAFQELTPELASSFGTKVQSGALVSHVEPGGPADKAGIKPGDVIERVDNREVHEGRDLLRAVLNKTVGSKATVAVLRGGKRLMVELTTSERPGSEASAKSNKKSEKHGVAGNFGFSLRSLSPELKRRLGYEGSGNVVVSAISPGSPAARAGLNQGDVIVEADRKSVKTPADVSTALRDGQALLRVDRQGGSLFIALKK